MASKPEVLEIAGGVATVFDTPRPIAFFQNGVSWAVIRTPNGLVHGQGSRSDWKAMFWKFEPLPGDGSLDHLVEKKLTKGGKAVHFNGEIALNANDPIPRVSFPIHSLECWRRHPVNYVDTGTGWVGRL